MKNDFRWMSDQFLVNTFRKWVKDQGIKAPSYQLIDRLQTRSSNKVGLTKRQTAIKELAAEFKKNHLNSSSKMAA